MSVAVDLHALADQLDQYGLGAFLTTVDGDGRPHVVSVDVELADGSLHMRVGRHSSANLAEHPSLSLLWPSPPGSDYALIVDGTADAPPPGGGPLTVAPTTAVLHRLAGATGDGPSCIRLEPS